MKCSLEEEVENSIKLITDKNEYFLLSWTELLKAKLQGAPKRKNIWDHYLKATW
jgi:hypothetical protein